MKFENFELWIRRFLVKWNLFYSLLLGYGPSKRSSNQPVPCATDRDMRFLIRVSDPSCRKLDWNGLEWNRKNAKQQARDVCGYCHEVGVIFVVVKELGKFRMC